MAEQEVFEMVLKQLKSQTSDVEVNSVNITKILSIAMEIVEATKLKVKHKSFSRKSRSSNYC